MLHHEPRGNEQGAEVEPANEGGVLRRALVYAAIAWTLLGSFLWYLYRSDLRAESALQRLRIQHVLEQQKDAIDRALDQMRFNLRSLARQSILGDDISRGAGLDRLERQYSTFVDEVPGYLSIRLLDGSGREVVRVTSEGGRPRVVPRNELLDRRDGDDFATARQLSLGEVFVSMRDRNGDDGTADDSARFVVHAATPVADVNGATRAILIVDLLGGDLLSRLSALAENSPGTILLYDGTGHLIRRIHDGDSMESRGDLGKPVFEDELGQAWARIKDSDADQFSGYEGQFTFASARLNEGHRKDSEGGVSLLKIVSFISSSATSRSVGLSYQRNLWAGIAGFFFIFVLSFSVAISQSVRAEHKRIVIASERRLRALSAELLVAQERERGRIARDLHDEVGQLGTAVHLRLQRAIEVADVEVKHDLIAQADSAVREILRWTHDMAAQIRPPLLDDLGFEDAILSFLQQFEDTTGISAESNFAIGTHALHPTVAEQAYRIIQEALTNVVKHARATRVEVNVEVADEFLHLEVRDDGVGFDSDHGATRGLGIKGIRERVDLLGGHFEVESEQGRQTVVRVTMPIRGPSRPV